MNYKDFPWTHIEEREVPLLAKPYLSDSPIILEAGCAAGDDTWSFKEIWPDCSIIGFEPHPIHYAKVKERMKGKYPVTLINKALSDHVGTVDFYMSDYVPAASSILPDNFQNIDVPDDVEPDPTKKQKIKDTGYKDLKTTVECTTIDYHFKLLSGLVIPDFIWLDLEGAELQVLKHGTSILSHIKVIIVEVNFQEFRKGMTQFDDLHAFMIEHGFELKSIWGRDNWQSNCLYVKKGL